MAAALLVRSYAPDVFALCRAMVRDTPLAEDLSHDTFASAIASLDGFRCEASPRTWLLKIARNRCLDHLARAKRAPWGRDPDPEPDAHIGDAPTTIELLANRADAEVAMAALGENERALVVLHFGHGVGYPELADSFGIGQGAVRMRVSRALAKMRDALHDAAATGRFAGDDAFEEVESLGRAGDDFESTTLGRPDEDHADADFAMDDASGSWGADELATGSAGAVEFVFNALHEAPSEGLWRRLSMLAGG